MLGERLRRLREQKKMTQNDVAKYLGITRPAYTQYENDVRKPDPDTLAKLADLFSVSIDYLVTGRELDERTDDSTHASLVSPEQAEFLKWVEENLEGAFFYEFHGTPDEMKEEAMETLKLWWEMEKRRAQRRRKKEEDTNED